ncbi:24612_t:CDS:2 [Gigaspora margarita]|uniref:24612_t:CDS:1 n=1 Tax=Gigaspora margarita TaxID=4874 RepID=A0ABM8W4U3_GIGMA|nr:24612_t:CDS:2 [Gigaspora margarita]
MKKHKVETLQNAIENTTTSEELAGKLEQDTLVENHKANYEEEELTDNVFEKSLTEADIIDISSNKPSLISKEFFSRLKEEAHHLTLRLMDLKSGYKKIML